MPLGALVISALEFQTSEPVPHLPILGPLRAYALVFLASLFPLAFSHKAIGGNQFREDGHFTRLPALLVHVELRLSVSAKDCPYEFEEGGKNLDVVVVQADGSVTVRPLRI